MKNCQGVPAVFLTSSCEELPWLTNGSSLLPWIYQLTLWITLGSPSWKNGRMEATVHTYSICAKEWGLEKGTLHPLKRSGIIYFKETFHLSSRILWILAASSRENCTCWKMFFQFLSEVLLHLGMLPALYRNLPLSERKAGNTAS